MCQVPIVVVVVAARFPPPPRWDNFFFLDISAPLLVGAAVINAAEISKSSRLEECGGGQASRVGPFGADQFGDGNAFGEDFFVSQIFFFFAPLQVLAGEFIGEPQREYDWNYSTDFVVNVHELDLDFIAKIFFYPTCFEIFFAKVYDLLEFFNMFRVKSNDNAREVSALHGLEFPL